MAPPAAGSAPPACGHTPLLRSRRPRRLTAAPGMIEIQVPEGAVPGATLEFQLDDGDPRRDGARGRRAGDRLQVPTDAADAPPPPPRCPRQTAPAATPETIEVQVPPGAVPGATIEFELDDGRVIDVPVPEGARAGDRLQVPLSLAAAAPPAESIEIQVPEGAVPGATLEFTLDDGPIDIGGASRRRRR